MTSSRTGPIAELVSRREGGTVTSLSSTGGANGTATVFAGTLTGVFRSDDAGRNWSRTSMQLRSLFVDAVAASPNFAVDRTVVAGTTDAGLHISYDGGGRWRRQEFWGQHPSVSAVAFSYAYETDETITAATHGRGVYVSDNGGQSWNGYGSEIETAEVMTLAVAVHDADLLLAGLAGGGVMRSADRARSWVLVTGIPPEATVSSIALSPSGVGDGLALAGTEAHGLYVSRDYGLNWDAVTGIPASSPVNALVVLPQGIIIVASENSLWRSRDEGESWARLTIQGMCSAPFLALEVAGHGTVLAGMAGSGVIRSDDWGETWVLSNSGLASQPLLDVELSPTYGDDHIVLAASPSEGVLVSRNGGRAWETTTAGLPSPTVKRLAMSPAFPDDGLVLALSDDAIVRSADGGSTWARATNIPGDAPILSMAFSPVFADDRMIVLGGYGGMVLISDDGGTSWARVNDSFGGAAVVDLAFSPLFSENETILAGTTGHGRVAVYRSADCGVSWSRYVDHEGAYRWASIAVPDADDPDEEFFCLATGSHVLRPSGTVDGHWVAIMPWDGETAVRAVLASMDFANDSTLYAATSVGLLRSSDRGRIWKPLVTALEGMPIETVAVARNGDGDQELFAATIGGEVWCIHNPSAVSL